jgi:hypothetical protein
MPTKKSSKKKASTKAATAKISPATAKKLQQTIKIDQLSKTVGEAVNRALATQDLGGIHGPIIMGIIWDPRSKTFTPYFQAK